MVQSLQLSVSLVEKEAWRQVSYYCMWYVKEAGMIEYNQKHLYFIKRLPFHSLLGTTFFLPWTKCWAVSINFLVIRDNNTK